MASDLLASRLVHLPEFAAGEWLNTERPLTKASLRGQVVLVDFWDYTCINCLRTLPYLIHWHKRYHAKGLVIIGVHAPEFKFGQIPGQVAAALSRLGVPYPILLDNAYKNWDSFANKAWPSKYLADVDGYIRFQRRGEGYYRETEQAIQQLLRQRDSSVNLPTLLPPLRAEDAPGAVCYRPTPELYAGYQGGGLFGGALGNPEGYVPDKPVFYRLPAADSRQEGQFFVDGVWQAWPEALAFAGQDGGRIVLPYKAAGVNAVLAPSADVVELQLDLWPSESAPIIEVHQDGRFLTPVNAGVDVQFRRDGASFVTVTQGRMMELVRNPEFAKHELELTFHAHGLALYSFTFTTCLASAASTGTGDTFSIH